MSARRAGEAHLVFDGLWKSYRDVDALSDVSFVAQQGQITGFVGRNGAGKSTALRIALGLTQADAGAVTFGGRAVSEVAPQLLGALLEPTAHPSCRVETHLGLRATRLKLTQGSVDEVARLLDLDRLRRRKIGKLSLGQRQRVGLAGALLGHPQYLVLDEPTNGLDPDGIAWLRSHLRRLADDGATVLVSSHILAELESMVDAVVVLDRSVRWAGSVLDMHQRGFAGLEHLFQVVTSGAVA